MTLRVAAAFASVLGLAGLSLAGGTGAADAQSYPRVEHYDDQSSSRSLPPGADYDDNYSALPAPGIGGSTPVRRGYEQRGIESEALAAPNGASGHAAVGLSPRGNEYSSSYNPSGYVGIDQGGAAQDNAMTRPPGVVGSQPQQTAPGAQAPSVAGLPPEDQPEVGEPKQLPERFRRQLVDYNTREPAGTIVVDTPNTYLYLVLGNGKALRYGIGVGREGFTWNGEQRVSKMAEWPDWHPPAEMIERQPYLPRFMAGGAGNPLGARALYLGNTLYRIHGTNQPSTIGTFVSSGCVRLINEDVEDLFQRVRVGTRVVVLPGTGATASIAH